MAPLAFVNGSIVDSSDAALSVFDHGLIVGDGAFETVLVRNGHAVLLDRHLRRLDASCRGLGLPAVDADEVRTAVEKVLASERLELGRLRITVTSGRGVLGSGRTPGERTLVVLASEATPPAATTSVAVVPWPRNERGALAGLKTTSYAENAKALAFAIEAGADEAIFGNLAGNLCEGTGSNVFVVLDGGTVVTPPLSAGCLAGITRGLAIECGAVERDLRLADFAASSVREAFLTSTARGVQPIAVLDGEPLAICPGSVTLELAAEIDRLRV